MLKNIDTDFIEDIIDRMTVEQKVGGLFVIDKYVTKIRIERAMVLLRENNFRTYEVAEMVGYSNAQYFSVSFKKYTGTSPHQFKDTKNKEE